MHNFKTHYFLTERVEKTDIIDLYIMLSMGPPDDANLKSIYDEKFSNITQNIKNEVEYIILRELRHALIRTNLRILIELDLKEVWARIFGDIPVDDSYLEADFETDLIHNLRELKKQFKGVSHRTTHQHPRRGKITFEVLNNKFNLPWNIDVAINMFENLSWHEDYGGDSWAAVARHAKKLLEAESIKDVSFELDRFIDYVHNTGKVLDKFYGSDLGWLPYLLDLKAVATNIRELTPYASHEIRRMMSDQAWRMALMDQPGLGADQSYTVIEGILQKHFEDFVTNSLIDGETEEWDWLIGSWHPGVPDPGTPGHIINELIENYNPDLVAKITINMAKNNKIDKNLINHFIQHENFLGTSRQRQFYHSLKKYSHFTQG